MVPVKAVVVAAVAKFGPLVLLWFLGAWVRVECFEFFGGVSWVELNRWMHVCWLLGANF